MNDLGKRESQMKNYAGPDLRVGDDLKPLLHLGTCFELRLDSNSAAVIRRGVIVAPLSATPCWFDDISFVGGFGASEQILYDVFAQVPDHLRPRVVVCGILESGFSTWKDTRVLDDVRLTCGDSSGSKPVLKIDSCSDAPQKRGRKALYEKPPKIVKVAPECLPCDIEEADMEDLDATQSTTNEASVTYHVCRAMLIATKARIEERLNALEGRK